MREITYTDIDGLTPANGTKSLDWTDRNGISDDPYNYHKDAAEYGDGYASAGYPMVDGETSNLPSMNYKTGDKLDFFDNGNVIEQPKTEPTHGVKVNGLAFDTIGEALSAMSGIQGHIELKLFGDAEVNGVLKVEANQEVVLDLNGKTLSSTQAKSDSATIKNLGVLAIIDGEGTGTVVGSKRAVSTEGGKTVIEGGIYTSGNCAFDVFSSGELTINDANVTAQEFGVIVINGSKLVVNGGTFNTIDNAVIGTNGKAEFAGSEITVNGGTFNGHITSSGYIACGIYLANDDVLNVNDGVFNIENGCGILVRSGAATVNSGVELNVSGDITGKVGDSSVAVPCKELVVDLAAHYPGGEPTLTNNTTYEVYEIVS